MRLQCCTCSASVPAWEDDFLVLDDSAPQAVEGGGKEAISVEDALYAQQVRQAHSHFIDGECRQLNTRGGGWVQRVEKKNIEHARSNYMLDTNAVCDGSSCAAQRPAHDAGGAATHPTSNREPLVLTGSTDSPDIPATATSFTPPPFTIILGLHHKCVNVERELGLRVSEGCGSPEGAGTQLRKADVRVRASGAQDGVCSLFPQQSSFPQMNDSLLCGRTPSCC